MSKHFFIITLNSLRPGENATVTWSGTCNGIDDPQLRYQSIFNQACANFDLPPGRTSVVFYSIEKM